MTSTTVSNAETIRALENALGEEGRKRSVVLVSTPWASLVRVVFVLSYVPAGPLVDDVG